VNIFHLNCRLRWCLLLATVALIATGCQWWPFDIAATSDDQINSSSAEQVLSGESTPPPAASEVSEVEPNDEFTTAQPVTIGETVRITGSITPTSGLTDRDIFDLGPAFASDRVLVDLYVASGADVVLGVFDARSRILGYIDLTSTSAGPSESDFVVRDYTDHLYVVLATRSATDDERPYTTRISIQRGLGEPTEHPQVLVLNFLGASNVRVGNRAAVNVPPFDAASINENFSGQTQAMIDLIVEKVRADFAGLNVGVYTADDPALPAGDHSTIYYGTYNARLLGLADNVDPYNSDATQSAILYTDTFAIFNALSPSLPQMAQALANTTSHEGGHLLGLRHTADPTDIMDTTATARQMMLDQNYDLANLNATVIPLGLQDAPAMLAWTLGGKLAPTNNKSVIRQRALAASSSPDDFYIPREWLMDCSCGHDSQP
jgi:hypothetical protein